MRLLPLLCGLCGLQSTPRSSVQRLRGQEYERRQQKQTTGLALSGVACRFPPRVPLDVALHRHARAAGATTKRRCWTLNVWHTSWKNWCVAWRTTLKNQSGSWRVGLCGTGQLMSKSCRCGSQSRGTRQALQADILSNLSIRNLIQIWRCSSWISTNHFLQAHCRWHLRANPG